MSILPYKDLSSASSSSSPPPSQNPNHGLSQYPPISPSHEFKSIKCLQISNSIDDPTNISAPVAPAEENSLKKVNESGKPNDNKFVVHQDNGRKSHSRRTSGFIDSQASSSLTAGRKTQMVNGNHLLNFYYDPISRPQPRAPPPRRHQKRKPYNKDLFLQANYKFVVLDCGNYAPEQLDPDKMLKWEDIICVKFSTPFSVQCPICLDDPLCPQITSCGHIFCFPCILQYFLTGEDDDKDEYWKKCPLCFVMISSKDLYTIYIENVKLHCIGDDVKFMLLTRQKDSFILSLKNNQGIGINEEASDSFSKFTFTSDVDLSVRKAISDLDNWLARADSGLVDDLEKLPYVCAAMEQLEKRRKYWNEQRVCQGNMSYKCPDSRVGPDAPSDHTNADPEFSKLAGVSLSTSDNGKPTWVRYPTTSKSNVEVCLDQIVDEMEPLDDQEGALSSSYEESKSMQRNFDVFKNVKDTDSYSFYQAVDGQHVVLHPLNMKCLLHHYGSYDMLPHRISGKILQLETVSQSEAMRRRYRFLSHFTLTTTFQLCEIDLSELLPPDTLTPFMDEIKNREKQRKRLARKDRDEKIRAEAALTHSVRIPFNSVQCSYGKPPTFSMDDFEALGSSSVAASSSSPPAVGERHLFSNVAKLGFAAGHDSPALQIDNSRSLLKHEVASDSSGLDGLRNAGPSSFASIISREKSCEGVDAPKMKEMVKKGKKSSRILLSTAGGRRY